MKLVVQFVNLLRSFFQSLPASRSDRVNPPLSPSDIFLRRFQKARALQTMQERIQRSRSNAITVMRQLLHHREAEDGLVRSMRQNMDAYETKKSSL